MKKLLLLLLSSLITFTLYADAPVKKTGQGQCFDTSTNDVTECDNTTGEDGNYQKGLERRYESDGMVVTDTATGLIWQDYGEEENLTWDEAITYCLSQGAGIRLPTRKEMKTIVHYGKECPAIDPIFQNTSVDCTNYDDEYWTVDELDADRAYTVDPSSGPDGSESKLNENHVRCVKGAAFVPSTYIRDDATETVYDVQANLTWQDSSDVNDATKQMNWTEALTYCENLNHGGLSFWRLPNINELYMLMDTSGVTPLVIDDAFKYKPSTLYWSSTTYAGGGMEHGAWSAFRFQDGGVEDSWYYKFFSSQVRCVRDGKIGTPSKFPGSLVYDSGWVAASVEDNHFSHNLGAKAYDTLIQVTKKSDYIGNLTYGGYDHIGLEVGYYWHGLTENNITVHKRQDEIATHFRVQMWQPPKPDFDSNWVQIPVGDTGPLPHFVGGDPNNYVVDLQFSLFPGLPPHQMYYGGITLNNDEQQGAYWHSLTNVTVNVVRMPNDVFTNLLRGRIWNVSQSSYNSGWNEPSNENEGKSYHPKPIDMNNTFIYLDQRSAASGINHEFYGLDISVDKQPGTYWGMPASDTAGGTVSVGWGSRSTTPEHARLRYFKSKSQMGVNPSIIMYLLN